MPRRFRFSARKNEWRKKHQATTLPISTPLKNKEYSEPENHFLDSEPLTISFALSYYTSVCVSTLSSLHSRLIALKLLQNGWMDATSDHQMVTFCRLTSHSISVVPSVDFTIKITEELTWTLFFHEQRIESGVCDMLSSVPLTLASPADVVNLSAAINRSQTCIGNPDDRFLPLLSTNTVCMYIQCHVDNAVYKKSISTGICTCFSANQLLPNPLGLLHSFLIHLFVHLEPGGCKREASNGNPQINNHSE